MSNSRQVTALAEARGELEETAVRLKSRLCIRNSGALMGDGPGANPKSRLQSACSRHGPGPKETVTLSGLTFEAVKSTNFRLGRRHSRRFKEP